MRAKDKKKGALVPRLRFPEFIVDREWDCAQMGDIYAFKKNNSFSRDMLNYNAGDVKNIHYGDIHKKFPSHFYAENENIPFVNCNINLGSISEDCLCTAGDIIFADASEDIKDIGKCIEIISNNKERILSGLHTIFTRQFSSTLVIGFGGYLFQSPRVRAQIQKEAQGTKILGISSGRLAKISISFPFTKGEQQKIADCLSSLDERITAETSKLDTLKDHKKGLLKQLFPAEGETLPQLRFPEFRDAGEWEIQQVGKKIDLLTGYPFNGIDISEMPKGSRLLRGINVTEGFVRHSQEIDRYYNNSCDLLEKFKLKVGDLVIGMDGSKVGKNSAIISDTDVGSLLVQRVARIRTKCTTLTTFIFHHINSKKFHLYVDKINTSSGIPHISAKQIKDFEIAFPSTPEQQRIADCLSSLDELITAQTQKIDLLKTHKKGLMQQLFPVIDEAKA